MVAEMASGDLTTVVAVRRYLPGLAETTALDELLGLLVTSESEGFRTKTDRDIRAPEIAYTEVFTGDGQSFRYLRQFPVKSITSVTVDGVAIPERTTLTGSG